MAACLFNWSMKISIGCYIRNDSYLSIVLWTTQDAVSAKSVSAGKKHWLCECFLAHRAGNLGQHQAWCGHCNTNPNPQFVWILFKVLFRLNSTFQCFNTDTSVVVFQNFLYYSVKRITVASTCKFSVCLGCLHKYIQCNATKSVTLS